MTKLNLADRMIAQNTLIMFANWMFSTLGYYGLSLNAVNLGGNIYVSFVLTALIEIPSYILTVLVIDHWGRKPLLIACQVLQKNFSARPINVHSQLGSVPMVNLIKLTHILYLFWALLPRLT